MSHLGHRSDLRCFSQSSFEWPQGGDRDGRSGQNYDATPAGRSCCRACSDRMCRHAAAPTRTPRTARNPGTPPCLDRSSDMPAARAIGIRSHRKGPDWLKDLEGRVLNPSTHEPVARRIVETMAFALQGSLLVRYSS